MIPAAAQRQKRFEELFNETRADLLAYALRRSRTPEDAADVLAETFLIAWRKLDKVPPGGNARLWLFGVARNVLRQGATREHAINTAVERLARELRDEATAHRLPEETRSPKLWAALRALPDAQREVLLLSAWEDLSPREIAVVTGTPVNLVRVRLHRARARLRRELGAAADAAQRDSAWARSPRSPVVRAPPVTVRDVRADR